jgi:hypothetical protein
MEVKEEERVRKLAAELESALAEAIYDRMGCHLILADQLWLMDDDTFTWLPPMWASAQDGVVMSVDSQEDIEDMLGPEWAEGLAVDARGEPIVTEEDAKEIAAGWAANNAYEAARDILNALEERQRRDEEWARYRAELEARRDAAQAAYEEAEKALRDMHKDQDEQHGGGAVLLA